LNKIIDNSFYPVKEAEYSNKKNRPIGIGVQGFANCLYELKIPFESSDAKNINVMIFETIYYSALKASCDLAIKYGPYSTFEGSPFSKGIFQFDYKGKHLLTGRYDWDDLRQKVIKNGTRNSLLTACMPTASTSNILNNFESFEPATHNIFIRKVISGEYSVVNRHLIKDLQDLKLWDSKMFNEFKKHYGSIQKIKEIPDNLKLLYKDVYEVSQKTLIELSADRQHFIDQSQSLNIYFNEPTIRKLTSMHFYGWKAGLKTGMYYLRTSSASEAAQFTVSNTNGNTTANSTESVEEDSIKTIEAKLMCSLLNKDECDMCSG
jgi:ribonucleoside-diphosphate reductase alpha chain